MIARLRQDDGESVRDRAFIVHDEDATRGGLSRGIQILQSQCSQNSLQRSLTDYLSVSANML